MKHWFRKLFLVLIVLGIIGGGAAWYLKRDVGRVVSFRTAAVTRGDLLKTIDATGTVEPEEVVDVGAQVAGQILSFGKDAKGKTIDYGSEVEEGTILAEIDNSLYMADAAAAEAQSQSAKANVQRAQADLEQLKAKLYQADRDWQRAQRLGPSEALAQTSYDAYQSGYETAKANVAVGEAAILQAQADLAQAQAGVQRTQRNLGYCTIKSPVRGVIIDRRVNIGQTVVSSLNAPSLFLLAKDLRRMQVWVAVNEMDIGKIQPGQAVSFTITTFPDETFKGEVGKVRLNASMTQNVVTYTVEILTDNSSGRLLPYLTADAQFELVKHPNVLLVPNAALKWTPSIDQIAPQSRDENSRKAAKKEKTENGSTAAAKSPAGSSEKPRPSVVWVSEGRYVRPVSVKVGLSDKANTEVEGENLKEGMEIVLGVQSASEAPADTTNPFTPKLPRGRPPGR
jgi:HlyD family secretion protein